MSPFEPTRFRVGGALGSAVLLTLALPPFSFLPLSFLALVPLAMALASLPPGPRGRWRSTLLGLYFGLGFWGFALMWVPLEVGSRFPWAYPGFLLLMVLLGGLSALFGWTVHHLSVERSIPLGFALPLAWVGVEWIKAHFPFGLAFPWLGLGVTLSDWPQFLGLAEWAGEEGVAFWLAGVNALVAGGILRRSFSRGPKPWLLLAGLVFLPAGLSLARDRTIPLDDGPRVAVVGTHVSRELRRTPSKAALESMAQVKGALKGLGQEAVDLVVLPEAAVPFPWAGPEAAEAREGLFDLAKEMNTSLVVGALGEGGPGSGAGALTNSIYLISPGSSRTQRYDKIRLVPGMERGSYERGQRGSTLNAGDWIVGPLLCYESLFQGLARDGRRSGAQLLVNLSSDIWFGREDAGLGSLFLRQHPAHLVLRAVENRISVARAANGGFSFILGPTGRVLSWKVSTQGGSTSAQIPIFGRLTLFSRTGDWVGPASGLLCLLLLGMGAISNRKRVLPGPWLNS